MAEQKKAGYPPIERVIGTIASVTTVAILFATQRQQLSFPAQVAVVSVLGILIILLFVWIWYRPIASYWTERRSVGTEDKISRESLDTFQSYVERLRGFATGIMDSPIYPLSNLKSQADFTSIPDFNPWLSYVQNLCVQFSRLLGVAGVNGSTFIWAVNSFSLIVNMFNDHIFRTVSEARAIAEQKTIPKTLREDYNTSRHTYIRFLDDYSAFIEQLNKQFRSSEVTYPGRMGSQTIPAFQPLYAQKPREL